MAPSIAPVSAVITENGLRHRSKARGLLNASNLPALQNLIKRDPASYTEEFRSQWNHYESLRRIYASISGTDGNIGIGGGSAEGGVADAGGRGLTKEQEDKFVALLAFVTQLAPSYPEMTSPLFQQLSTLLLEHHSTIGREVRSASVRSLVLMRNRDVITGEQLLKTLFPLLLASPSSSLRSLLHHTITTDLRNANAKSKNHSLNRVVQGLLFSVVEVGMPGHGDDANAIAMARAGYSKKEAGGKSGSEALWAVRLAAELWKKKIWNDEKTVSLLSLACLHPHPRVQSSAIRFFLGDLHSSEAGNGSGSDDGSDAEGGEIPDIAAIMHRRKINKKTRSNDKKVRAAGALAKRRRREAQDKKQAGDGDEGTSNVAAIHLLHDPHGFGEKLFDELKRGDKRLAIEAKVRMMQLLARIMSCHHCSVLGLYSYVVKYLNPHQTHITLILVSVAQSVHSQTPPSSLLPLIRKVAHIFVHPGVGPEVVAAGLNTIREICSRQVWALGSEEGEDSDDENDERGHGKKASKGMDDGKDLLEDLISYRRSKDKGVAAAARGLLTLYRRENPSMLPRKERGKDGAMNAADEDFVAREFGQDVQVTRGITGLDMLEKALEAEEEEEDSEDEEEKDKRAWEGWNEDSDEESDASSQGWIDVSSEGEEFDVSDDSADEKKKKAKDADADEEKRTPGERVRERRIAKREARRIAREGGAKVADDDEDVVVEEEQSKEALHASAVARQEKEAALKEEEEAMSTIATTRILTPADFAKLNQLRIEAARSKLEGTKSGSRTQVAIKKEIAQLEAQRKRSHGNSGGGGEEGAAAIVDEVDILGVRKKRKMDYEERMAHIKEGREGREVFGSKKGKKNKEKMSSSNNEAKKKSKPFAMIQKSWSVRSKKSASLTDKSRRLKAAKEKQKKQYK
ncbi:hypothetical protein CBS101457_003828 [Exobasidium rhododendri]|nr:hypothetical protein CBS101457_003828 [Exobasidium rhododendri]